MTLAPIFTLPRKAASPRFWPGVENALHAAWQAHGPAARGQVQPWRPTIAAIESLSLEMHDDDRHLLEPFVLVVPPPSATILLSRTEAARTRLRPFLLEVVEALQPMYLSLGLWAAFLKGSKKIPPPTVVREPLYVREFLEIDPNQVLADVRAQPLPRGLAMVPRA